MKVRAKVFITGVVQGVGFRPFVYRLATSLGLSGYVLNSEVGVVVEVEGAEDKVMEFLIRVQKECPPVARIYAMEHKFLAPAGYTSFEIRESEKSGKVEVSVLPDLAVCDDCLREMRDPRDRRYRYPFINCTNCGPRFTIIEKLPYDRANTSMKKFKMCPLCLSEYEDPASRRFHAQPNACPVCGPRVFFLDESKRRIAEGEDAIAKVIEYLKKGKIVAVKGLGGFHLLCDATLEDAVAELRRRKLRREKPFAVMFPDLKEVKKHAFVSPAEERALTSVETPIVILEKRKDSSLADAVSPGLDTVGAFLPYTPLHHILLSDFRKPVVATSANLTEEPIAKTNEDAISMIGSIADGALLHDRDIVRRCDDSVVTVMSGRQVPIRRSRGYAPLPILLPFTLKRTVLALGGHMKNTVAVAKGNRVYLSQHIGDLDNVKAEDFFEETVRDMLELFEVDPEIVVCDRHPLYFSSNFGKKHFADRLVEVFHHHAHIVSCMAENEVALDSKVIGVSFDGTGFGEDGTVWGGEFLLSDYTSFERLYHLKTFRLPGGEKAIKEPYRTAFSLLRGVGEDPGKFLKIDEKTLSFLKEILDRGFNAPVTSSMGRLFDGISAILGIKYFATYEAQPAILLERIARLSSTKDSYRFKVKDGIVDWRPVVEAILGDIAGGKGREEIARKFHNGVCDMVLEVAREIAREKGIFTVALSGGVFQNRLLTECAVEKLKSSGFSVLVHQLVPPNDGGISLGQAVYGGLI